MNPLKKLSQLNEAWLGVFGLLAIFIMIEGMHTHYHHKAAPYCASIEAPQSRISIQLALAGYVRYPLPSRRWERPQIKT